jgi:hypothetical protein
VLTTHSSLAQLLCCLPAAPATLDPKKPALPQAIISFDDWG